MYIFLVVFSGRDVWSSAWLVSAQDLEVVKCAFCLWEKCECIHMKDPGRSEVLDVDVVQFIRPYSDYNHDVLSLKFTLDVWIFFTLKKYHGLQCLR